MKNRTSAWSSNSTSGYLSKEIENTNSERYMHPHVHCSVIYNSQDMETTKVSIDGWRDICIEILFSRKKRMKSCHMWQMDGPQGHYAKWGKTKKRQIPYDLSYMWTLQGKKKAKLIDTENRLVVARGRGWDVGSGRNGWTVFFGFLV